MGRREYKLRQSQPSFNELCLQARLLLTISEAKCVSHVEGENKPEKMEVQKIMGGW